jgi:protein-S-isoprenylcysteine O-methyltransferase Ste14
MKQTNAPAKDISLGQLLYSFIYLTFLPLLLFALADEWRWFEGLLFSIIFCLLSYATLVYLYFADPELLKERFGSPVQKEQKPWDKVLVLTFISESLVWFVIMPLDAKRFAWTPPFPLWIKVTGTALLLIGFYLLFAALRENTFAAPVVKMQKERGQHVISTGPYAIVRHPLYSGATLLFISAPLLLSSYWGLALALMLIVTLAIRSVGEEAMLKEELAGYREYARKVRWRMIPFVF